MGLKILHVTNVAQNAYINAKILNDRGHDCDLLAFDLYHVACSPEWYELMTADIDVKLIGDDTFFPDFYALGRGMPVVGDWVAHGPMAIAITYLILKRRGDPLAHLALSVLSYFRFKATMQRTTMPHIAAMTDDEFERRLNGYDMPLKLRRRIRLGRMADTYSGWIRERLESNVISSNESPPIFPISPEMLNYYCSKDEAIEGLVRSLRERGFSEIFSIEYRTPETDTKHLEALDFMREEVLPFVGTGAMWRELAALYDICIFYGDSTNHALASRIGEYNALEHGTIRSVPFTQTVHGRLLKESYKRASRVFLTNTDYATASPRLEFTPEQRIYFPHPFDEAPAVAFRASHSSCLDPTRAVFLCPARQEWTSGSLDLTKGNDLYFRAGRMLIDMGRADFIFNCIDWGVDREASRRLVAELGIDAHVRWLPMLPKRALWAAMLDAHAVIDQFYLSALGGVGIETLALGRRLISRDDGINNAVFFETPPPVLAAATVEEVTAQMLKVMDDREDSTGRGEAGAVWIAVHHSADRICSLQMAAFDRGSPTAEPRFR